MAMVYKKFCNCTANGAFSVLRVFHCFDLLDSQPVTPKHTPFIQRPCGFFIIYPPVFEAFISFFTIINRILSAFPIGAFATIRADIFSRFCEFRQRQILIAIFTGLSFHTSIIHQQDSPCHADVLAEIANSEE